MTNQPEGQTPDDPVCGLAEHWATEDYAAPAEVTTALAKGILRLQRENADLRQKLEEAIRDIKHFKQKSDMLSDAAFKSEERAEAAEARTAGSVLLPARIVQFLMGSAPIDGVWFDERHPKEKGQFWWRERIRAEAAKLPEGGDARDAERYRWIRKSAFGNTSPGVHWNLGQWDMDIPLPERLDVAIDAARKEERE